MKRRPERQPLFVGESNPVSPHPADALYPWPETSAGGRLRRALGLEMSDYFSLLRRENLFALSPKKWDGSEAKARAKDILTLYGADGDVVFLLGNRVAQAFGMKGLPLWGHRKVENYLFGMDITFVRVPHPSGCLDPSSRKKMRALARKFL